MFSETGLSVALAKLQPVLLAKLVHDAVGFTNELIVAAHEADRQAGWENPL